MVALLVLSVSNVVAAGESPSRRPHERWIWTELIAFDNERPDLGVGEYIDKAGFVPTAVCLLIGSPDFWCVSVTA
jgi:hypothetical protein